MSLFGPRRIGLALGSGAARGLAHIGVLKVLEAEGLRPDAIAGTSMGALVGAFYAAGIPVDEMERIALEFDPGSVTGAGEIALTKGAVFSGQKVQAFLRQHLPETFEELEMPFGCVATDLVRNVPVRFTSGDLISAIRASVSVPLALVPVQMDGMLLVDGYISEPIPVSLARNLGVQTVLAVEVCGSGTVRLPEEAVKLGRVKLKDLHAVFTGNGTLTRGASGLDVLGAASEALEGRLAAYAVREADVAISPEVHDLTGMEYDRVAFAIEQGEIAMRAALPQLRRKARRPA
jgi:NTE family protein